MQRIIIFDFDRTLFDTDAWYPELLHIAGCKNKQVMQDCMSSLVHKKEFQDEIKRAGPVHVFKRAQDILQLAQTKCDKLVLLTRGNLEFQKQKVSAAGIEEYFDEIRYEEDYNSIAGKAEWLREITQENNNQIYVINDNEDENILIRDLQIKQIQVMSVDARQSVKDREDTIIKFLQDLI